MNIYNAESVYRVIHLTLILAVIWLTSIFTTLIYPFVFGSTDVESFDTDQQQQQQKRKNQPQCLEIQCVNPFVNSRAYRKC